MTRRLLAGTALLLWSTSAQADMPVIDVAHLAQALKEVAADEAIAVNTLASVEHLRNTVSAVMHGDVLALANLGPELSALGIGELVNPGADGTQLLIALSGVATETGQLSVVANNLLTQDAFHLPTAGDWTATNMVNQARAYAAQKALAQSSFNATTRQITALRAARDRATAAGDVTAAAQANTALTGVMAQAQMEQNQLKAAEMMSSAQDKTVIAQTQQMSRCSYERLAANAKAAKDAADGGTVQFITNASTASCATSTTTPSTLSADGTSGTLSATDASASSSLATGYNQYIGTSVGSGQCVALVQQTDPSVGLTATWTQGQQVLGNSALQPGTPIATFGPNGTYTNSTDGSSHAAIYLGQTANGIQVEDQWLGQPAHIRTITTSGTTAANNASQFYVIGSKT